MFLKPMLLESGDAPFDDKQYWFEPKINGHRLILSFIGGKVRLYTRYNQEITRQYPELHNVPVKAPADIVLDGEVAYVNPDSGRMEFETLIERFKMTKPARIREAMKSRPVGYFIFDILHYNGDDLRLRPLIERKRLLHEILEENASYHLVKHVEGSGSMLFDAAIAKGMEGIVAKRSDSMYSGGRSGDWRVIRNVQHTDLHISGYRKGRFGLLGYEASNYPPELLDVSVPKSCRPMFYESAKSLVASEDNQYYYLEPKLKIRVRFERRKKDGRPHHPQFEKFIVSAEA